MRLQVTAWCVRHRRVRGNGACNRRSPFRRAERLGAAEMILESRRHDPPRPARRIGDDERRDDAVVSAQVLLGVRFPRPLRVDGARFETRTDAGEPGLHRRHLLVQRVAQPVGLRRGLATHARVFLRVQDLREDQRAGAHEDRHGDRQPSLPRCLAADHAVRRLLLKAACECSGVVLPPWPVESIGHHFHHHHVVFLRTPVRRRPQALRRRANVRGQPAKGLAKFTCCFGERVVVGRRSGCREENLNQDHARA